MSNYLLSYPRNYCYDPARHRQDIELSVVGYFLCVTLQIYVTLAFQHYHKVVIVVLCSVPGIGISERCNSCALQRTMYLALLQRCNSCALQRTRYLALLQNCDSCALQRTRYLALLQNFNSCVMQRIRYLAFLQSCKSCALSE